MEVNETSTLVILNKNDSASLDLVLKEVNLKPFAKVIGIDGNSEDDSRDVFDKHGIKYFDDVKNGRGGAIRFAIDFVDTDFVFFLSSDGEENPAELPKMIAALKDGADLVIASRIGYEGSGFKSDHNFFYIHRKVFLWLISWSIRMMFGGTVKDCWNGYRGMRVEKAREVKLIESDFLLEAEMTIKFLKNKLKVVEIPTQERKRFFGDSQNPAISSGWGHVILLFREFFVKV